MWTKYLKFPIGIHFEFNFSKNSKKQGCHLRITLGRTQSVYAKNHVDKCDEKDVELLLGLEKSDSHSRHAGMHCLGRIQSERLSL